MKICYVITKADEIGGAQIHIRDLSLRLKEEGHKVDVIVGEDGALVTELRRNDIAVHIEPLLVREINFRKDIKAAFSIRKLFQQIKPDLISLHSSKAGIIGRLAAVRTHASVLFTAHGWAFANGVGTKQKYLYCLIEKLMSPLADKIITVSEQDKELAIRFKVASECKQIVIHNGMPNVQFSDKDDDRNQSHDINLISVARFSEQKDHKTLFLALSELQSLRWKLRLVGKGPLLEHYKQYAKDLGIYDRIEFLGERHDVATLLSESDIFLLISNWEGFPYSILEAMRAELPVIASNVGGASESVLNEKTGFLIERGNTSELIQQLEYLMTHSDVCKKMGREGRKRYIDKFTFDAMYLKTKSLYESLIQSK